MTMELCATPSGPFLPESAPILREAFPKLF